MASCYLVGKGVKKDVGKGFELLKSAALGGYPDAMYYLACCFGAGLGTAKNEEEALKWYRKAIESGFKKEDTRIAQLLHWQ